MSEFVGIALVIAIVPAVMLVAIVFVAMICSRPKYCPYDNALLHAVSTTYENGYECEHCKRVYDSWLRDDPFLAYKLAEYRARYRTAVNTSPEVSHD